jgi:predicted dehydrogenase
MEKPLAVSNAHAERIRRAADRGGIHALVNSHLIAVVRGKRTPNGLSSLANNMNVTEILEAARESAQTHKSVALEREQILVERSPARD